MPHKQSWLPRLSWFRWLSLGLSFLAICGQWQFMSFTVYLNAIKEQFALTQLQVDLMLGFNNFGFLLTFPAGLIVRKHGCHRACALATTLAGASYLLLWSATYHRDFYFNRVDLLMVYFLGVGIGCAINFAVVMEAVSCTCPTRDVPGITSALMSATNVGPLLFTCLYTVVFYGERYPHGQRLGDYMLATGVYHVVIHSLVLLTYNENNRDIESSTKDSYELHAINASENNNKSSNIKHTYGTVNDRQSTSHPSFVFDEKYTLPSNVELGQADMNDNNHSNILNDSDRKNSRHELNIVDMIYALNRLKLYTSGGEIGNYSKTVDSDYSIPNSPTPLLEDEVFDDDNNPIHDDVKHLLKPLSEALKSARFYLILWACVLLMGVRAMCVGNLNAYLVSFCLTAYSAHLPYVSPVTAILIKLVYTCLAYELGSRTPSVGLLATGAGIALLGFILAMFPLANVYAISFVIMLWTFSGSCALCATPAILKEAFGLEAFHVNTGLVITVSSVVSLMCQIFLGALYDLYAIEGQRACYGLFCYIWCFGIGAFLSAISVICIVVYAQGSRSPAASKNSTSK